jgi:hypothetical protein
MTHSVQHPSDTPRSFAVTAAFRVVLATTAALWLGAAYPQTPPVEQAPSAMTELPFREFFQTPVGPAGVEISDTLHQAHGKKVRLVGYMVQQEKTALGRFMLTPRPVQMSEHADGEADDLPPATVMVYLDASQQDWAVPHVRGLVELNGVVSVGRFEERDGRVSWVRLQLAPEATQSMNSFEVAGYLHALQHRH